ncbi:MAG TPA: hypothetical protein VD927_10195 [Chryseosolibacter sp.]|nr:hypothetical protein [Chryseosolibacter sp.]
MIDQKLKASAFAASALAFASFGDAFLYAYLPVNYLLAGVPLAWVGVLLSINRFVRIFSNTAMVRLFDIYGLRTVTILAVITAIVSTLGYAFASSVLIWLTCRIIWGLSFSAMRVSTLAYGIQNEKQGIALGLSRGLQEAGPMIALLFAPFLLRHFQGIDLFLVLAVGSLPALLFAFALPKDKSTHVAAGNRWRLRIPSLFNCLTLVSAILIDGIVVIVLGTLFLLHRPEISLLMATSLAAFYLGYRRMCLVILSPLGGWLADKFGVIRIFNVSLICVIAGLALVSGGWISTGLIIMFTSYSVNAAITPGVLARTKNGSLFSVAENATWRDVGAAVGTLAGGFLLNASSLKIILFVATIVLAILFALHIIRLSRSIQVANLWR